MIPVTTYLAPDGETRWPAYSFEQLEQARREAAAAAGRRTVGGDVMCDNCDGAGGWKTAEWVDPVSGPECEGERCEVCEGTGKLPVAEAAAQPTLPDAERPEGFEVAPCPFCGSSTISDGEVASTLAGYGNVTQSECQECGALGPWADLGPDGIDYGDIKARAAWNRRAAGLGEDL